MNQRDAKRIACRTAWRLIDQTRSSDLFLDHPEADRERLWQAMDRLAQELFRRGGEAGRKEGAG